ncbi:MAG: phosphotransferase [Proteobacteria bacterium]|nr:phosphotransferase [Pseudomonadota bacterium]
MTDFTELTPEEQNERLRVLAFKALARYGHAGDVELSLLEHRENAVYKVVIGATGERFALRVHRHGYHTENAIRSELKWMSALTKAGVLCPAAVPALDGDLIQVVEVPEVPQPRVCDLFHWIEGSPPKDDDIVVSFRTLGELSARIHLQATNWPRPDGFERHTWDEMGLLGENALWGRFTDLEALSGEQRALLIRARDRALERLIRFGKTPDRYGLIHADLMPENILIDGDEVRVIDFDDSGFGWHLYDLATALYFHLEADYLEAIRESWLSGYGAVTPLPERHIEEIDTLVLARALVCLGWVHTRRETRNAIELTDWLIDLACEVALSFLAKD